MCRFKKERKWEEKETLAGNVGQAQSVGYFVFIKAYEKKKKKRKKRKNWIDFKVGLFVRIIPRIVRQGN